MNSQTTSTEKRTRSFRGLKPFVTLILYVIGFAVGFFLLFTDYLLSLTEERHHQFFRYYQSKLWLLLLIIQTMFWAAVCAPMWRILRSLKHEFAERGENWKKILGWLIPITLLLFLPLFYVSSHLAPNCGDYGLRQSAWKTQILTVIGFLVAFVAAIALLLTSVDLTALENDGPNEERVSRYIERRRHALRLLTILGVMTTLATLGFGAKRNAIFAMGQNICPDFKPARVLLHGLFLTIVLALAFFPIYAALLRTGRKIVCDVLPMPKVDEHIPSEDKWPHWYEKKKGLEELLQLSVTENLKAVIAVLAPIAGSLVSILRG